MRRGRLMGGQDTTHVWNSQLSAPDPFPLCLTPFPSAAFPKSGMGRLPQRKFRGLIGSSLALRPACSRGRRTARLIEGSDGFVTSAAAPIATGWSDPDTGRELHPLKIL